MFPTVLDLDGTTVTIVHGTADPYVKNRFYFLGYANRRDFRETQAQHLMDLFAATLDGHAGDRLEVLMVDRVTQRTSTAAVQAQARNVTPGSTFYSFCVQLHKGFKIA